MGLDGYGAGVFKKQPSLLLLKDDLHFCIVIFPILRPNLLSCKQAESMNRRSISVTLAILSICLVVSLWQWQQTDARLKHLEQQLLAQREDTSLSVRSLVKDPSDSRSAEARYQTLEAMTAQLQQQVEALQNEIDLLKQSGAMVRSGLSGNPIASTGVPYGPVEHWTGGPKRNWGHEQATGEPDTYQAGDIVTAWAPKAQDGGEEWLQLDYEESMDVSQINVIESHNPGAISKVTAIDETGQEVVVWEGTMDPSKSNELITSEFPVVDTVRANKLKVYLDTTRVSGWNEIDAVQMIGNDGNNQWAISSSASSSYSD